MKKTAEEFIREKIKEKFELRGQVNALWKYEVSGEDAMRWAHEFAQLSQSLPPVSEEEIDDFADEYVKSVPDYFLTKTSCRKGFYDGFKAALSRLPQREVEQPEEKKEEESRRCTAVGGQNCPDRARSCSDCKFFK